MIRFYRASDGTRVVVSHAQQGAYGAAVPSARRFRESAGRAGEGPRYYASQGYCEIVLGRGWQVLMSQSCDLSVLSASTIYALVFINKMNSRRSGWV